MTELFCQLQSAKPEPLLSLSTALVGWNGYELLAQLSVLLRDLQGS